MNETVIRINSLGDVSVEETVDGVTKFKRIQPDDLIQCINASLIRGGIFSGLLPNGCLSYSESDDGNKKITMLFPEKTADFSYYDTIYKDFPLPRLVFGFNISAEGHVIQCDLGVVANDDRLKPETPMFHYPFSNVSGFRLCTGNNVLPKCKNTYTLGSIPYYILAMPNNDDHFKTGYNKRGFQMRELLEHLKGKDSEYYYSDVLIPYQGKTLGDFIR